MRFSDAPAAEVSPEEWRSMVMHVGLPILDGHLLMGTDAPDANLANHVSILLMPDTKQQADELFAELSEGGADRRPMQDMFWGDDWGQCTDRFDVAWQFDVAGSSPTPLRASGPRGPETSCGGSVGQHGPMSERDDPPTAARNAPDRQLAGMAHVDVPEVELTDELQVRREAVAELGDALRELTVRAIESEVDAVVLHQVAADARRLAAELAARERGDGELSSVDDLRRGQRPFNPVVGAGNPVAPPMRVEIVDGSAIGTCTLDGRYEGPPTYAHGGVSALLLDQIMGYAAAAAGHPGMTGRLQVRYFAAVPLGEPLNLEARLIDVLGVRAAIRGSIRLASDSAGPLVEAEGSFLALRPEQAERLFGDVAEHGD